MSVSQLVGALHRHRLTAPLPQEHVAAVREREQEGDVYEAEPLLSPPDAQEAQGTVTGGRQRGPLVRDPSAISDRLAPIDPGAEIPDESDISTTGWDEEELGVEAWAWYRSFHWEPTRRWGIYLTDEGIWRLSDRLRGTGLLPTMQRLDVLRASTNILLLHECFHFLTDIAASGLELADPAAGKSMYVPHAKKVAAAPAFPGRPREEALANAFVDRRLRPINLRPVARAVFNAQPDGYRDFGPYLGAAMPPGCRGLASEIAAGVACNVAGDPPHELLFDLDLRHYGFGDVPIWLVRRLRATPYALAFIDSIDRASIVETRAFRKDLRRLPKGVLTKLDLALDRLADTSHPGLQFKPLNNCGAIWSIRVGKDHRIALKQDPPEWKLLRILPRGRIYREVCA